MSQTQTIKAGLAMVVVRWAMPWLTIRHRRQGIATLRETGKTCVRGTGALFDHAVLSIFSDFALCGAPVESMGGPGSEANCPVCRRILRKGAMNRRNDEV